MEPPLKLYRKPKSQASMLRFVRKEKLPSNGQASSIPDSTTNGNADVGSSKISPKKESVTPAVRSKPLFIPSVTETEVEAVNMEDDPLSVPIGEEHDVSPPLSPAVCSSPAQAIQPKKRKRIQMFDSDDDIEPVTKQPALEQPKMANDTPRSAENDELVESLLKTFSAMYPSIEKMEILDVMRRVKYNFNMLARELEKIKRQQDQINMTSEDRVAVYERMRYKPESEVVDEAAELMKQNLQKKNHLKQVRLAEKNKKKQAWKVKGRNSQEFEEEEQEDYIKNTKVYESDSSEDEDEAQCSQEVTPGKWHARNAVLNFYNEATSTELTGVPGCSKKKADIIIDTRPFEDWNDIVQKLRSTRWLHTDLLNSAKDLLMMRDGISKLMKKCENIASTMSTVVSGIIDGSQTEGVTKQPEILKQEFTLKPYQLVGLNWLILMYQQGLNGVLADEMGLGKTIQSIAFLAYLKEQQQLDKLCLIVVPASTLDNWAKEFELWCPSIGVLCYHGTQDVRRGMRAEIINGELDESIDVILTTYNMITSSTEDKGMFKKMPFHTVIFDEAHMLKNMNSQRYENLMKMKTKHRLLLTGTPLQNNLVELMSILVFVMPELFEGKKEQLRKIFSMFPKSEAGQNCAQYEKQKIEQAKRIMKPFFLRRLKQDVLKDLPTKECHLIKVPMSTETQKTLYKETVLSLSQKAQQIEEELESINDDELEVFTDPQLDKDESPKQAKCSKGYMLMTLRKLANHPLLVRNFYTDEKIEEMAKILISTTHTDSELDYVIEDLMYMSDFEIHKTCFTYKPIEKFKLSDRHILESGKFRELDQMLPEIKKKGDRVLIFSQFVIMLDIIEDYMKICGHSYYRLDGRTQVSERQELIDEFNDSSDIFVFLLSTRAGGLGINLTAANNVIIHDIDFNPYNDRQAEDRCHRVGQTRSVTVHRFISKDTIEEGMHQIALQKLQLERDVTNKENCRKADVLTLLKTALSSDQS